MCRSMNGLALMILMTMLGCGAPDTSLDQRQANKALVLRYIHDVWGQGDMSALDEIVAADYVGHWATDPATQGREALKRAIADWRASFPDWHEEAEFLHASAEYVFMRGTEGGTFEGNIGQIPPNGRQAVIAAMAMYRIDDGKIAEQWTLVDDWGMEKQLGIKFPDSGAKPGWN